MYTDNSDLLNEFVIQKFVSLKCFTISISTLNLNYYNTFIFSN